MRKYIPKIGSLFKDRKELVDKLESSGWRFEGQGTSVSSSTGKATEYDVGVTDVEKDQWIMVFLKPYKGKLRVTKIRRLKLSDYKKPKARRNS